MSADSLSAVIYRRVDAVDVRALPLTPEEAYVLSRVEGQVVARTIASETGISAERVSEHLDRLEQLGAVSSNRPAVPEPTAEEVALLERYRGQIDESLDLPLELQLRILDLAARLADLDHFELLGISQRADRATVKRAYFSTVGDFHPDTYFGKKLGAFTKRMEKVFQRLTEAHDVLTNRQSREEYESYLAALGRTRGLDTQPPSAPGPNFEDLERLLLQAEQAQKKPEPPATATRTALLPPVPEKPQPRRQVALVDDPVARRQALARKFGLTKEAPSAEEEAPKAQPAEEQAARRTAAVKDLHKRYQHRRNALQEHRVERFAHAAEEALAAGNAVSALNTLKIAQSISGGHVKAVNRLQDLEKQLGGTVADSYLERARYEETNGHFEEAARSYTRGARARPSADVFRSAAECYLKAGVELRLAGELAREAVQIAPDRVDLRLTLAKIYEAAGMQKSAVRELERALELTPESDRIKQWLKRVKRGGV